jgi:hypothetical protein
MTNPGAQMDKLIVILLTACAFFQSAARAETFEPLNSIEIKREIAVATTLYLDYVQTVDIKNHPGFFEKNIILGLHPKDNRVTAYFLLAGAGHYGVTRALPREYRAVWQYGWIALEVATILNNKKIGLHFDF